MPTVGASTLELPSRKGQTVDGRRLRSERTRLCIIEAYLELVRKDPRMPTAADIAEAAGYSVRSVFERFTDLRELTLATADHAIAQGQAEAVARHIDADRPTRIRSHVETRALACERWLPLWRVITMPGQLPDLAQRVFMVRLANIERLKLMYGPELALIDDTARQELLIVLATLTSFESWDQMRHCHGLSMEAAQRVWCQAIDDLLPSTG